MNPKDLVGAKKAPLTLVPPSAVIAMAEAMLVGANKYGPFNWRDQPVQVRTYVEATLRHLYAFLDGQWAAEDTHVSHLAHAMASLAILNDAFAIGAVVDNRSTGPGADLLRAQDKSTHVSTNPVPGLVALGKFMAGPDMPPPFTIASPHPHDPTGQPVPGCGACDAQVKYIDGHWGPENEPQYRTFSDDPAMQRGLDGASDGLRALIERYEEHVRPERDALYRAMEASFPGADNCITTPDGECHATLPCMHNTPPPARAEGGVWVNIEPWGTGDGTIFGEPLDKWLAYGADMRNKASVENRGEWPPDTRVNGLLTCCGQSEHPLDCPQWR